LELESAKNLMNFCNSRIVKMRVESDEKGKRIEILPKSEIWVWERAKTRV